MKAIISRSPKHSMAIKRGRLVNCATASWTAAALRRFCTTGTQCKAAEGRRSPKPGGFFPRGFIYSTK